MGFLEYIVSLQLETLVKDSFLVQISWHLSYTLHLVIECSNLDALVFDQLSFRHLGMYGLCTV